MTFETQLKVRFDDVDHAGVVYFPRYLDYAHRCFEDFFEAAYKPYETMLNEDSIGWPTVRVECDYKAPSRFGDRLDIEIDVVNLGKASMTCRHTMKHGETIVCVAKVTSACIDMHAFKAVPIPAGLREALSVHLIADA